MKLDILWHEVAKRELLNLPWRRAAKVDQAVIAFGERGAGNVRRVETVAGQEYVLLAAGYEIRFSVDRDADTMVVWAVWPVRKRKR